MKNSKNIGNGIVEHTFDVEFPDEIIEYTYWSGEDVDLDKYYKLEQQFEIDLINKFLLNKKGE